MTHTLLLSQTFTSSSILFPPHSSSLKALPLRGMVRCSVEKEEERQQNAGKAVRREVLVGMMGASAAMAMAALSNLSPAAAESGPGTKGAERTAKKADELLKAADKLNVEDAPPRFGPGRVGDALQDAGRIAQKAGSGAVEELQGGASDVSKKVKGGASDASKKVKGGASDVSKRVQGGASDVSKKARESVEDNAEKSRGLLGKAQEKAGELANLVQGKVEESKN